jgi:methyl-accepting chemotaxis protein
MILAALLCVCAGWTIVRAIAVPVGTMTAAMRRLAGGDTAVEIAGIGRGDEIGAMAGAVEVFKRNTIARARLEAEQKELEARAAQEKQAALIGMAEKIEEETGAALEGIGFRIATVAATAEEMSASAGRTGAAAKTAATAATRALANAQTVASAAEQLAASIREIGSQVHQSSAVVGRAVTAGSEARARIEALNERVGLIGSVADMIREIAARTNLLALNASIEAARAGDAGKGFAVVASEVKQLATQTARSTQEISVHIAGVLTATGASVASVREIEQTIGAINAIAGSIAAAVEEQGVATAEIARSVSETAAAADTMTGRCWRSREWTRVRSVDLTR